MITDSHSLQSTTLTLFCYLRGDHYTQTFPVEIDKEKSAGYLKEVIKEKKRPKFDNLPADSLFLWNVSVPINRDLINGVEALNLLEDDALSPSRILTDIFPDLEKDCIHFVIDQYSGEL